MEPEKRRFVSVRRQWNGHDGAEVDFDSLENVHWDTVSGGVRAPSPQPFLHGYIQCDKIVAGSLAHSCVHGDCPHEIKVCIVRKGNDSDVFAELVRIAGPKPTKAEKRV
jgi:hypothetical protein